MIIHGGEIFITNTDGTAFVYAAKSCEINAQCEMLEVSSPQSGKWRSWLAGRCQWSVGISHLVTSIPGLFPKLGDSATIYVKGVEGPVFDGFVDNPNVASLALLSADSVWWDITRKRFVGKKNDNYSLSWSNNKQEFLSPHNDDIFTYDGKNYLYESSDLQPAMLTGSAIFESQKMTATKGNLAQGSVQLRGNGPLTPVTVPTSL